MFHPTVFDNIKTAIENQIYDYDNLDGILLVTDRSDLLDLAIMSREFRLSFQMTEGGNVTSEVVLLSSLKDLSDEILDTPGSNPGCRLLLRFYMRIKDEAGACPAIEQVLSTIWGPDLKPVQTLSFIHGQQDNGYYNSIELAFNRQITEEQMEDLPELLSHVLRSAQALEAL